MENAAELQRFQALFFRKLLRTAGNRKGSFTRSTLLSGQFQSLCEPNNFIGEDADYCNS